MNFNELISKTLEEHKGQNYHTYKTYFDDGILKLQHYSTIILVYDTNENEIKRYRVTSQSDKDAIAKTMRGVGRGCNWLEGRLSFYRFNEDNLDLLVDENGKYIWEAKANKILKDSNNIVVKSTAPWFYSRALSLDYDQDYYVFEIDTRKRKFYLRLNENGDDLYLLDRNRNILTDKFKPGKLENYKAELAVKNL